MILQALTAYYEQLLRQGKIAAPGWDGHFKVSYELRLNDAGQLLELAPLGSPGDKGKWIPSTQRVPAHVKRASGIAANFLCDNCTYLLGADDKGKPERSLDCFKACAALHHAVLDGVDSPAARAILAFFDSWDPSQASTHQHLVNAWADLNANANLMFGYIAPDGSYMHSIDDDVIKHAWEAYYNNASADSVTAQCLITGKVYPIERTHPNISGVPGAQSSGASLVSFNAPAFCSYGHEQGENAPVSKYAAFAYTTALNRLIADRDHCKRVGDTTILCWAECAESAYQDFAAMAVFDPNAVQGLQDKNLQNALKRLALGQPVHFQENELLPGQHFYVLGISPNAARLSVRFFFHDTFGAFARNFQRFLEETAIVRPAMDTRADLSVWSLALSTVRTVKGAEPPAPSQQLSGDLLRAVLSGCPYPATLLNGVTQRIRAEHGVSRGRAAALKAYYLRNYPTDINKEVFTVSLNESTNLPYVLGRLFSVLEAVQEAANPGINTTIKDRYFSSACATPALVFPTLLKLSQKHLQKLPEGRNIFFSKQIAELTALVPETGFPARLSLPDQGKFEIGYYHQTQKRYTRKNEEE